MQITLNTEAYIGFDAGETSEMTAMRRSHLIERIEGLCCPLGHSLRKVGRNEFELRAANGNTNLQPAIACAFMQALADEDFEGIDLQVAI